MSAKEIAMSAIQRIESLKAKHANLEQKLHEEETRPHPDETLIHRIKKEKLEIKDEIERLQHADEAAS